MKDNNKKTGTLNLIIGNMIASADAA